jgi:hypothetical protein
MTPDSDNNKGSTREAREGWPLLTVETEANGDLWSTYERAYPWLVRWARRAGTIDFCPALAALVSTVYVKYCFSHRTLFHFTVLVPIAQQPGHWAGSRAGSPVSVS